MDADHWPQFFGDNSSEIESSRRPPGPARLSRHLGKPLSPDLWDDILRLRVRTLRVCTPEDVDADGMLVGHLWHQMTLFLDADGRLADFWLHGHTPARKAGVTFEDT